MINTESAGPVIPYSSYNPKGGKVFIYLINKSELPQQISIAIPSYQAQQVLQVFEYYGSSDADMNPVWQKRRGTSITGIQTLKGSSITVFEVKITRGER